MSELVSVITSADPRVRNRPLDEFCRARIGSLSCSLNAKTWSG